MKLVAIALNTFRESIRNKVLYSVVLFTILMVGIAALFASASLGDQRKFVKDFSLLGISLFGLVAAVIIGVSLLSKEIGRKTIYNILAKPVARWEFVVGKFLGLFATLAVMVCVMTLILMVLLAAVEGRADWGLLLAASTVLLELMVVVALALFFSAIVVTPTLAGMFTVGIFVAGRSAGYLSRFLVHEHPPLVKATARLLYWTLPRFDWFNIADQVVYGEYLDTTYFLALIAYGTAYAGILLVLAVALFSRREFT